VALKILSDRDTVAKGVEKGKTPHLPPAILLLLLLLLLHNYDRPPPLQSQSLATSYNKEHCHLS
jgi:hypothetical protein